jgi:ketosteroid isomerase-like protein
MEGDLPWPALETFADAVVADPNLARELFAEYDRAWQAVDVPTYVDLYVPAIFALAAPKLGEEQRREIGSFLVDKLIEASIEEADLTEEALLAASGSMGPVILPKVLDALESMTDDEDSVAWSRCWNLTALAAKTEDAGVRNRTI